MRLRLVALGMLLFLAAPAWASDVYTFTINSTKYSSLTTFSVNCSGLPSATCALFGSGQITNGLEPGSGAKAASLVLSGTADVAVFSSTTEVWTFGLSTSDIDVLGTYGFTGDVAEVGLKSGSASVTGTVMVTDPAMPEPSALWSLLLVLIPTFLIGWRKGQTTNFRTQVDLPASPGL